MRKKVLIIDDEVDFCLLLKDYLTKKNCFVTDVSRFSDGLNLIELLEPDVIIVDANSSDYSKNGLQNIINSIENYAPHLFLINGNSTPNFKSWFDSLI